MLSENAIGEQTQRHAATMAPLRSARRRPAAATASPVAPAARAYNAVPRPVARLTARNKISPGNAICTRAARVAIGERLCERSVRLKDRDAQLTVEPHLGTKQDRILIVRDRQVQQEHAASRDGQPSESSEVAQPHEMPLARGKRKEATPHVPERVAALVHSNQHDAGCRQHPVGKPETELVWRNKVEISPCGGLIGLDSR